MMGFGWIGILLIGALLFSRVLFPGESVKASESPFDIAKARYAKGDINKDEFDQIKHGLGG